MTDDIFSVSGKVALVTGATSGIGAMIADALVSAGATVFVCSRKVEAVNAATEHLGKKGACIGFSCDITQPEQRAELVARVAEHGRGLNILINNAGRTWGAPLEQFPVAAFGKVNALNLEAPFALTQGLLPQLEAAARRKDPACVINIGSILGLVPSAINAYSYAASKAAIHHLTRVLAVDLAERHITVNAIAPGYFPSRMWDFAQDDQKYLQEMVDATPLRRAGTPEDIAGLVITLSSRAGSFMTGNVIPLDGGSNLVAGSAPRPE